MNWSFEKINFIGYQNKIYLIILLYYIVNIVFYYSSFYVFQDTKETACLRLFIEYHGLSLLWSWMVDIAPEADADDFKIQVGCNLGGLDVWDSRSYNKIADVSKQALIMIIM